MTKESNCYNLKYRKVIWEFTGRKDQIWCVEIESNHLSEVAFETSCKWLIQLTG
jgi:hypothetical protein